MIALILTLLILLIAIISLLAIICLKLKQENEDLSNQYNRLVTLYQRQVDENARLRIENELKDGKQIDISDFRVTSKE